MPIDRTGRDLLRNALTGFMHAEITSTIFGRATYKFSDARNDDRSLVLIAQLLEDASLYCDDYILDDRQRARQLCQNSNPGPSDDKDLSRLKQYWRYLLRLQAFLATDLEIDPALNFRKVMKRRLDLTGFFPFASDEQAKEHGQETAFDPSLVMGFQEPKANPDAWTSIFLAALGVIPVLGFFTGLAAVRIGIAGLTIARKYPKLKGKIPSAVGLTLGALLAIAQAALFIWGLILPALYNKPAWSL